MADFLYMWISKYAILAGIIWIATFCSYVAVFQQRLCPIFAVAVAFMFCSECYSPFCTCFAFFGETTITYYNVPSYFLYILHIGTLIVPFFLATKPNVQIQNTLRHWKRHFWISLAVKVKKKWNNCNIVDRINEKFKYVSFSLQYVPFTCMKFLKNHLNCEIQSKSSSQIYIAFRLNQNEMSITLFKNLHAIIFLFCSLNYHNFPQNYCKTSLRRLKKFREHTKKKIAVKSKHKIFVYPCAIPNLFSLFIYLLNCLYNYFNKLLEIFNYRYYFIIIKANDTEYFF